MQKAVIGKMTLFLAMAITAIASTGCIVPSQQAVKTNDVSQEKASSLSRGTSNVPQGLIKPTIPGESQQPSQSDSTPEPVPASRPLPPAEPGPALQVRPDPPLPLDAPVQEKPESSDKGPAPQAQPKNSESTTSTDLPPKSSKPFVRTESGRTPDKAEWEDQKVKETAQELAHSFPQATKIKICYAVKDDEWWVTFYDNAGAFTDLKQYTWNRDLEKLEAFLVVKRIPSSRVQQHLVEEEVGKACQVIEAAKSGTNP